MLTDGPAPQPPWGPRAISGWALWTHRRSVVIFVLLVMALGFGSATLVAFLAPVHRVDVIRFGLLAACALAHLDITRGIERMRKTAWPDGTAPHLDLRTVWNFAALLLLPPALATAMVVLTALHVWLRVRPGGRRRPPHRVLYTTATILIANQVATAILLLAPGLFPGSLITVTGFAVIIAAALVRWLINYALVVAVILMDNPQATGASALLPFNVEALEIGATGMAVLAALLLADTPIALPVLVIVLIVFHRCVLLAQFQHAASTDDKTGLLNSITWTTLAAQELARAQRTNSTLGVLMIDLDNFKQVNDTHGHPAGDHVLRAVARALRAEVRLYDHVGRYGGEEFVIALPGVSGADLHTVGERLRHRIRELVVTVPHGRKPAAVSGLTASIGGAHYPITTSEADDHSPAQTSVDELLRAADGACYDAKRAGRDRLSLVPDTLREHQLPVDAEDESR